MRSLLRGGLFAALVMQTALASAQVHDPLSALEARVQNLEDENRYLSSMLNRPQTVVKDTGPDFLGTNKHNGLIAGIEYLHWTVRQPGLEYGITDIGGVQDRGAVGQVLALDGDYEGGWRATLGYRFDADCACACNRPEFLVTYTNFSNELEDTYLGPLRSTFITADNSENNDSDNGTDDITPDDRATSATASYDFNIETLDLQFAQSFAITRTLDVRLAAIGRFAMIDEDFRVSYAGGDFGIPYNASRQWDFQGGGLMLGSQLDWRLTQRLSMNFGARAGALMGRRESRYFFPDDEPGVPTNVTHNTTQVSPIVEVAAMVNYTRDFGRFELNVGGGYEVTNYFNMAENRLFTDSHQEGMNAHAVQDLTLDGLVGRISINY